MYSELLELVTLRKRIKRLYGMERITTTQLRYALGLAGMLEAVIRDADFAARFSQREHVTPQAIANAGLRPLEIQEMEVSDGGESAA